LRRNTYDDIVSPPLILGVLLTETMLITTENPGPLPLRSHIRQTHAESGTGRIWDHDIGLVNW